MKTKKQFKEKRKYQRYTIKHGAYASTQPAARKSGPIIDISLGGVLFKYLTRGKEMSKSPENSIYLGSLNCFVSDISYETIDDSKDSDEPNSKSMEIRKNRVKFKTLSSRQSRELNHFICINAE